MLSPPSQPCADTWQGKSCFYFKTPTFKRGKGEKKKKKEEKGKREEVGHLSH